MTDWKSSLRSDPIPWLLDNACAPIRYRVLTLLKQLRVKRFMIFLLIMAFEKNH